MPVYKSDLEFLLQLELAKRGYRGVTASWMLGEVIVFGKVANSPALVQRMLPPGSDPRLIDRIEIAIRQPGNLAVVTCADSAVTDAELKGLRANVQADVFGLYTHLRYVAEGLHSSTHPILFAEKFSDLAPWKRDRGSSLERQFNRENFRVDVGIYTANPGRLFGNHSDLADEYELGMRMVRMEIVHYTVVVAVSLQNAGGILAQAKCIGTNAGPGSSGVRRVAIELLRECRSQLAEHARVLSALL